MRTEIESNIEKALIELVNDYSEILHLTLGNNSCSRDESTHCRKGERKVYLQLIEPTNHADLQKWVEEIVKAEELCQRLSDELAYELNHPNFFRAMQFRFSHTW